MKPGLASAALAAALLTTAAVVSAAAWVVREPHGRMEHPAPAAQESHYETGAAVTAPRVSAER